MYVVYTKHRRRRRTAWRHKENNNKDTLLHYIEIKTTKLLCIILKYSYGTMNCMRIVKKLQYHGFFKWPLFNFSISVMCMHNDIIIDDDWMIRCIRSHIVYVYT